MKILSVLVLSGLVSGVATAKSWEEGEWIRVAVSTGTSNFTAGLQNSRLTAIRESLVFKKTFADLDQIQVDGKMKTKIADLETSTGCRVMFEAQLAVVEQELKRTSIGNVSWGTQLMIKGMDEVTATPINVTRSIQGGRFYSVTYSDMDDVAQTLAPGIQQVYDQFNAMVEQLGNAKCRRADPSKPSLYNNNPAPIQQPQIIERSDREVAPPPADPAPKRKKVDRTKMKVKSST